MSVITGLDRSVTWFKGSKPSSLQNKSAKMFPGRSAELSLERSARKMYSSVTPTITKSMERNTRRSSLKNRNRTSA